MFNFLLLSSIGCLVGHRSLLFLASHRMISLETLAKLRIIFSIISICVGFLAQDRLLGGAIWIVLLQVAPVGAFFVWLQARKARFNSESLLFLDEVILKMRAGMSIKESLKWVGHLEQTKKSFDLSTLIELILTGKSESGSVLIPLAQNLYVELVEITQLNVKALDRLVSLRASVRVRENFRQKSSRATDMTRAQMFVMSGIYVLFSVLMSKMGYLELFSQFHLLSSVVFIVGILVIRKIERSFQWKT